MLNSQLMRYPNIQWQLIAMVAFLWKCFEILQSAHNKLLHAKRQKMETKLDESYTNIPRRAVEQFLKTFSLLRELFAFPNEKE